MRPRRLPGTRSPAHVGSRLRLYPGMQRRRTVRAIGVITDRDICIDALFHGKPLRELYVSTKPIVSRCRDV
jgi:hypothetical protein